MDYEEYERRYKAPPTLCWDCHNALGYCEWSARAEPVKGWTAKPTSKQGGFESYLVTACPKFKRDATGGGIRRYHGDDAK